MANSPPPLINPVISDFVSRIIRRPEPTLGPEVNRPALPNDFNSIIRRFPGDPRFEDFSKTSDFLIRGPTQSDNTFQVPGSQLPDITRSEGKFGELQRQVEEQRTREFRERTKKILEQREKSFGAKFNRLLERANKKFPAPDWANKVFDYIKRTSSKDLAEQITSGFGNFGNTITGGAVIPLKTSPTIFKYPEVPGVVRGKEPPGFILSGSDLPGYKGGRFSDERFVLDRPRVQIGEAIPPAFARRPTEVPTESRIKRFIKSIPESQNEFSLARQRAFSRIFSKIFQGDNPLGSTNVLSSPDNGISAQLNLPGNTNSLISGSSFPRPSSKNKVGTRFAINPFFKGTYDEVPAQELPSVIVRDFTDGRKPMITRMLNIPGQIIAGKSVSNNPPSFGIQVRESPAQEIIGTSAKAQIFISPPSETISSRQIQVSPSQVERPSGGFGYERTGTVITQGPRLDFTKTFSSTSQPIEIPNTLVASAGPLTPEQIREGRAVAAAFPGESRTGEFFRTRISEPIAGRVEGFGNFLTKDRIDSAPNLAEYNLPPTPAQQTAEQIFFENFKIQRQTEEDLNSKLEEFQQRLLQERKDIESGISESKFGSQEQMDTAINEANKRLQSFSSALTSEFESYQKQKISEAQKQSKQKAKEISTKIRKETQPISFRASELAKKVIPEGRTKEESEKLILEKARGLVSESYPNEATYDLIGGEARKTGYSDAAIRRKLLPIKTREAAIQFLSGAGELARERPLELATTGLTSAAIGAGIGFLAGGPAGAGAGITTALKLATPILLGGEAIRIGLEPGFLAKSRLGGQIAAELTPVLIGGALGAKAGQALRARTIRGLGQSIKAADVDVTEVRTPQARNRIIKQLTYDFNNNFKAKAGLQRASDLRIYKANVKDPITGEISQYVYIETGRLAGPLGQEMLGDRLLIGAQLKGGKITGRSISTFLERADEKVTDLIAKSFIQQQQVVRGPLGGKEDSILGKEIFSTEKIKEVGSVTGIDLGEMPTRVTFLGKTAKTNVPKKGQILTEVGESTSFEGKTIRLNKVQADNFFDDLLSGRQASIGKINFPTGIDWETVKLYPRGSKFTTLEFTASQSLGEPSGVAKSFRLIVPKSANINLLTVQRLGFGGEAIRPLGISQQFDISNVESGLILDKSQEALLKTIASGKKLTAPQKVQLNNLEDFYGFKFTLDRAKSLLESLKLSFKGETVPFSSSQLSAGQSLSIDEFQRIANLPKMVGGGGQGTSLFYGQGSGGLEQEFIRPEALAPGYLRIGGSVPFLPGTRPALGTVQLLARESSALSIPLLTAPIAGTIAPLSLLLSPRTQALEFQPLNISQRKLSTQLFEPRTMQLQLQEPRQRLSNIQSQVPGQRLGQIQIPRVRTRQISNSRTRTSRLAISTSPTTPPTKPGKKNEEEEALKIIKSKKGKGLQGFEVDVRRKGKFKAISEFAYPKEEALALGAREVLETSAASFRIRPSSKPVKITGVAISSKFPSLFRAPKSGTPGVFVQRKSARISSPGEIREISLVGARVRKSKGKGNPFFS